MRVVVGAALTDGAGRVLAARRTSPPGWEFPGGKVEAGESRAGGAGPGAARGARRGRRGRRAGRPGRTAGGPGLRVHAARSPTASRAASSTPNSAGSRPPTSAVPRLAPRSTAPSPRPSQPPAAPAPPARGRTARCGPRDPARSAGRAPPLARCGLPGAAPGCGLTGARAAWCGPPGAGMTRRSAARAAGDVPAGEVEARGAGPSGPGPVRRPRPAVGADPEHRARRSASG